MHVTIEPVTGGVAPSRRTWGTQICWYCFNPTLVR
jgi:hypothetical protein